MLPTQNEPYQRLINYIHQTDAKLKEDAPILNEKIEMNSPDWKLTAMRKMERFAERNKPYIQDCANLLAYEFPLIDNKQERDRILQEIHQTKLLKNYLTLYTHCDTEESFRNTVTLFIVTDLGIDSRDWILALNDCVKEAFQNKIDVSKKLKSLLFLTNDFNHHGLGSAKDFIEDLIRKYE